MIHQRVDAKLVESLALMLYGKQGNRCTHVETLLVATLVRDGVGTSLSLPSSM